MPDSLDRTASKEFDSLDRMAMGDAAKQAAGSLVSAFPSPFAPAIGMAVAQTKQSDIVGGFMQAVSNIHEEEKRINAVSYTHLTLPTTPYV